MKGAYRLLLAAQVRKLESLERDIQAARNFGPRPITRETFILRRKIDKAAHVRARIAYLEARTQSLEHLDRGLLSREGRETFDIVMADLAEDRREMLQRGLSPRVVTGTFLWHLLTEGLGLFWQQALKVLPRRTPRT